MLALAHLSDYPCQAATDWLSSPRSMWEPTQSVARTWRFESCARARQAPAGIRYLLTSNPSGSFFTVTCCIALRNG